MESAKGGLRGDQGVRNADGDARRRANEDDDSREAQDNTPSLGPFSGEGN